MVTQQVTSSFRSLVILIVFSASCATSTASTQTSGPASGPAQQAKHNHTVDFEKGFQTVLQSVDIDGNSVAEAWDKQATALVLFASWCGPCRHELALLGELVQEQQRFRVIGLSYNAYEEYDERSDDTHLRKFLAENAPWLRVVRVDDALMETLGRPRKVPSLFLFNREGRFVTSYLRANRQPPTKEELRASISLAMLPSRGE